MSLTTRLSLSIQDLYTEHILTRPFRTLALGAAAILLSRLYRAAGASYAGYAAMGRDRYPLIGWLAQAALQPFARRDLTSPAPYRDAGVIARFAPRGRESFLPASPLPRRVGPPPEVPGYVFPQRQVTARAGAEMQERMRAVLDGLVAANAEVLTEKPSGLEGVGTPAVFLRTEVDGGEAVVPGFMAGVKGETVHVHHQDGSTHVTLSLADAEEVLAKGWGRRHKLSGVAGKIPYTYLLIYAPRDEEEFEVWKGVVTAGCRFVVGRHDLRA